MNDVVVAIGTNLGNRHEFMLNAETAILNLPESSHFLFSSIYQSVPINCDTTSPVYLNAVVKFTTRLTPYKLLELLQQIENANERERPYFNAPRTLDLDVILFGNHILSNPKLTVPHRLMHERFFVLTPICEIAPNLCHPILEKNMLKLESSLMDKEKFITLSTEQFVSNMTGSVAKTY